MDRREVVYYAALFVFGLVMLWNGQSIFLVAGMMLATTLIVFTIYVWYPMAREKRMDRVENFLRRNHYKPYIYFYYVTANRLDEEVEITMEKLRNNSTNKSMQAVYQAAYGVYRKDMFIVRQAVPNMRRSDYRTYYETCLLIEEGMGEQAREHLKSIRRRWMQSALLAEIERKLGHREMAIQHAEEAVSATNGAQRYMLVKEYERCYAEE